MIMIMDCMKLYDLVYGLLFVINWRKDMMEMGIMPHVWRMATKPTGLFWQVLLTMQMIYTVQAFKIIYNVNLNMEFCIALTILP